LRSGTAAAIVNFAPHALRWREIPLSFLPLRRSGPAGLFFEAFLVMGGFVTLSHRLPAACAPFNLSQTAIGAIFIVYLVGSASSAWVGHSAGRFARRKVLWLTIAVADAGVGRPSRIGLRPSAGMVVVTAGFSGRIRWPVAVGDALQHRAQAASLYLLFYYLGSSVLGTAGGWFWRGRVGPGSPAS
jgi:YNFM family putative membrane transporter